jgi:hypothetical protein
LRLECDDWRDYRPITTVAPPADPYEFVISANIHRRHLTAEQKRELIAKLLKAKPEVSDRQIAKQVKVDHKTVATVRKGRELRGEIPHVEARTDTKGRKQPAKKQTQPKESTSPDSSGSGVSQVSPAPEKLSSELPTGSDSSKTPIEQGTVAEMEMQPQQSWMVVAVAEDGRRYGSGARFKTKEEARAYMVHAHRPLWEYAINEIRIALSQDSPNVYMDRFDKGRDKGKVRPSCRVCFEHGTCGNLVWGELDAREVNACDDGLDIPDYLKRAAS